MEGRIVYTAATGPPPNPARGALISFVQLVVTRMKSLDLDDKQKTEEAVQNTLVFLVRAEYNNEPPFQYKWQKEKLEEVVNPIMMKVYGEKGRLQWVVAMLEQLQKHD